MSADSHELREYTRRSLRLLREFRDLANGLIEAYEAVEQMEEGREPDQEELQTMRLEFQRLKLWVGSLSDGPSDASRSWT